LLFTKVNVLICGKTFNYEVNYLKKIDKKALRLQRLKPSGIRRMFDSVRLVPDAISLTLGEPDFSPPSHVLDAFSEARGASHYTPNLGIPELREALARKAKREYGLSYDPNTEIIITAGGTEAVFLALLAIVNPEEEVLVPNPGFVCYEPSVYFAEGKPVALPLREENDFKPSLEEVRSLITEKSRVMIINFPNNPTGSVLSYNEASELAKMAVENDLIVISDEVYEKIIYDDSKHYCLAAFPEMRERTIVINSFSKTYAMTGYRVGYAYGPTDLINAMKLVHQYTIACINAPAQYAALAALEGPQDFVKEMVREFDRRRRLLYSRLNEIEGFKARLPKGAFYAFPNVEAFKMPSEKFCDQLLFRARVATVPGSAFGEYGEGYIRLSYATSYDQLEKALDRIEQTVKELRI